MEMNYPSSLSHKGVKKESNLNADISDSEC